jgi:hypothetical protein
MPNSPDRTAPDHTAPDHAAKEPSFLAENQSVASMISHLHRYFDNTYSHYKTEKSSMISNLHGSLPPDQQQQMQEDLNKLEAEIAIFGALSDALSVADRLLHARAVINELGLSSEVYKAHREATQPEAK